MLARALLSRFLRPQQILQIFEKEEAKYFSRRLATEAEGAAKSAAKGEGAQATPKAEAPAPKGDAPKPSSNPTKPPSEPPKASSPPPKPTQTQDPSKAIKASLKAERSPYMTFWIALGGSGFAASYMYYTNESDRHERHVQTTVKMVDSPDPQRKRLGLNEIENCLWVEKRMLSGYAQIPQPKSKLVDAGLVSALYGNVVTTNDAEIQEKSLVWLLQLSDEPAARQILLRSGMNNLIEKIRSFPVDSSAWIAGTALISTLIKYDEVYQQLDLATIKGSVQGMYQSNSPLATLMSTRIANSLIAKGTSPDQFGFIPEGALKFYSSLPHTVGLNAAIKTVIPPPPTLLFPIGTVGVTHLAWASMFGLIGGLYGRIRWTGHSIVRGLGSESFRFAGKRSKCGRYVFVLLTMDLVAQLLMAWPKEGLKLPFVKYVLELPELPELEPKTTSIPIIESGLFISTALWGIRKQRYIVLPLILAALTKGSIKDENSPFPSFEDVFTAASKGYESLVATVTKN